LVIVTNPNVEWSVIPDTGNASIDNNGLLTAIAPGIVNVTATAKDGSEVSVSKEVTIVVDLNKINGHPMKESILGARF